MEVSFKNKGMVVLLDFMGSDLAIVNAARVSFKKTKLTLEEEDIGLINYLMKHRHGTPFEMVQFKFRVECPIFVAREWQRHRIGSFNEVSTRYVEMEPIFYYPHTVRTQVGKVGHYKFEEANEFSTDMTLAHFRDVANNTFRIYENLLLNDVAKEVARDILPLNLETQFIWSVNLRSLLNFIMLRSDERALEEIRILSKDIEEILMYKVPHSYKAFVDNGRIAP